MRNTLRTMATLAVLCVCGSAATALAAGPGKLKGALVVSDQPLPSVEDANKFVDAVRKWGRSEIPKPEGTDTWSFHVVAFPDKKPGSSSLTLLFFDASGGKREYLTRKDINVDANADILAFDIDVTVEDGIKPGQPVEMVLARITGDKQFDLAKAKVTFK